MALQIEILSTETSDFSKLLNKYICFKSFNSVLIIVTVLSLFQKTVIAVVSEDKRVKKFGKKHKENVLPPIQTDERPIQSEGNDRKKPRMPWLKKKKKVSTVDREFFDKWISIPDTVFNQNHNSVNKKRRSVPEVWTNNEYNYDYQQPFESARRQEYVGYYGDY